MTEEIKLTIAIPTSGRVSFAFAYSLASLTAYLTAGLKSRIDAPQFSACIDAQASSVIHSNREILVRRAIDKGQTHLLFIDDDMAFNPEAVNVLFSRRHPVVACNYLIKDDEDLRFVAVDLQGRRLRTDEKSTGLHEISYSGFGLSLFDLDVFRKTPQPWFQPKFVESESLYTTEDNPCFERIREAGFKCYLDQDASKMVEHCGEKKWAWNQWKPKEVNLGSDQS